MSNVGAHDNQVPSQLRFRKATRNPLFNELRAALAVCGPKLISRLHSQESRKSEKKLGKNATGTGNSARVESIGTVKNLRITGTGTLAPTFLELGAHESRTLAGFYMKKLTMKE